MGGVALLLNQPLRNSRQRCFGDWESGVYWRLKTVYNPLVGHLFGCVSRFAWPCNELVKNEVLNQE